MGPDGSGIQNSYITLHGGGGGHSTMHQVPAMSGDIS